MAHRREVLGVGLHQAAIKLGEALPDIPIPDPGVFYRSTSRRKLLTGFGLTSALLMACSTPKDHPQPQVTPEPEQYKKLSEVTPALTKAEVRSLLENLQASPYKDFVMRFGYPFFQDQPPPGIAFGEYKITFWDFRVRDISRPPEQGIGGGATIRAVLKSTKIILQEDHNFTIILPHIGADQPGESSVQLNSHYRQGDGLIEGIEPEIRWYYPKDTFIALTDINRYRKQREYTILKEAFTVAFSIAYFSEIINHMHLLGLPVYFDDGGRRIEVLSQSLIQAEHELPRLMAVRDICPFIIAAKAVQSNQALMEEIRSYSENVKTLDAISNLDFGAKPEEMVRKTIEFILQNKEVVRGVGQHVGHLDPFP